ncbi:recombinase family protein [Clostridium sp. MCC353]|uniref:recombinase family protein n=1 Tax=Clostridium sp. MCC353 TaxID=2592646 RepID=UPI001C0320F5|nr:recombinase family protein [Clostridium sp. MCC353]MBT9778813.1 recombinase family protein [Clostridium sp. MCC353]
MLNPNGVYFAYLRKSREDRDAEQWGAEDTLARHEYIINDLAARHHITISKWFREVVSGETITDRPQMQLLLSHIERLHPDGVLVVEVERLSRGNPQDQGRVTDTFKYAGTLIITPVKIYDLQKENDEEWLDFGLMRSRMEYRTIKRRMQNGRTTSAMQGKYIGNIPPYGWIRKKLDHEKGYILEPCPDTGWVLKLIYTLMDSGTSETNYIPAGASVTARTLDGMGIKPPKGEHWDTGSITRIVKNPANIGLVRIGYRRQKKVMEHGSLKVSRPINDDCILVPARWKGQIDPALYDRVCQKLKANTKSRAFPTIQSPLAGLVYCSVCGKVMRRRPAGKRCKADTLQCRTCRCSTVGSYYSLVEDRLLTVLDQWLEDYEVKINAHAPENWKSVLDYKLHIRQETDNAIRSLECQLSKVHNYFEKEIYDLETFTARSQAIKHELEEKLAQRKELDCELEDAGKRMAAQDAFPQFCEHILDSYRKSNDPLYKNTLLKLIIKRIDYSKTERGGRDGEKNDSFELVIHVKL